MRFNPSKCNIMHIHRVNLSTRQYTLCSEVLQSVTSAKYLGISISQDLSWKKHIDTIAARANTTLHFIHRNLKHCPRHTREVAYCSLVRSSLEYGAAVWDPHHEYNIDTLERVN